MTLVSGRARRVRQYQWHDGHAWARSKISALANRPWSHRSSFVPAHSGVDCLLDGSIFSKPTNGLYSETRHQDKNSSTAKAATPAADILAAHNHWNLRLFSGLYPRPGYRSVRVVPEIKTWDGSSRKKPERLPCGRLKSHDLPFPSFTGRGTATCEKG